VSSPWLEPLPPRQFDRAAAAHLLERAALGAAPAALEAALAAGPQAAVAELFAAAQDTEPPGSIELLLGTGALEPLQAWWLRGLLEGPGPLRERATLLWHGHFATSQQKVRDVRALHGQQLAQRRGALGPFAELLRAMLTDPALLIWLDGTENRVGAPNENLARELLELFALGRGHYGEQDVREGARALSGWRVEGRRARLSESDRDRGEKHFLGRRGDLGVDEVVAAVVERPPCADWLARRLAAEYLGPQAPPAALTALAGELRANGLHVGATLQRLFVARGFYDPALRNNRVASPAEWLARAARTLELKLPATRAARLAERLGQSLFQPPTVEGWEGGRTWLHPGSWVARRDAARECAAACNPDPTWPEEPAALLDAVCARLLPGRPAPGWLDAAARAVAQSEDRPRAAVELVLLSPEFQLH
jgi:uncharacterized protein (DUF1800 family)